MHVRRPAYHGVRKTEVIEGYGLRCREGKAAGSTASVGVGAAVRLTEDLYPAPVGKGNEVVEWQRALNCAPPSDSRTQGPVTSDCREGKAARSAAASRGGPALAHSQDGRDRRDLAAAADAPYDIPHTQRH